MSSAIHLKRNPILICGIVISILLTFFYVYHEQIIDTPTGQRRILQAELQERIQILGSATLKKHLPIFKGGVPRRVVIFANDYARFEYLEEILLTIPGIFIHKPLDCEPSTDAGDDRDWTFLSEEFRNLVINETLDRKIYPLLHCEPSETHELLGSSSILSEEVQEYCKENSDICSSEYFQRQLCEMSTLQVLVLKNFDFNMALHLKNYKYLHLLYMIRDPRAIYFEQIERRRGQCANFTHCYEVDGVCRAMRSNENGVTKLVLRKNFKLLRYEDLAYNMMQELKLIFDNWGIENTIETYTVMSELKPKIDESTFEWYKNQPYPEIQEIQEICKKELEFYAYRFINEIVDIMQETRTVNDLLSRLVEIARDETALD